MLFLLLLYLILIQFNTYSIFIKYHIYITILFIVIIFIYFVNYTIRLIPTLFGVIIIYIYTLYFWNLKYSLSFNTFLLDLSFLNEYIFIFLRFLLYLII